MIDERERACDEAVIRAGKRPADYAEGILAVCRWSHEWPVMCVSGVTGSDLRTRIETILANRLGRRLHMTGRVLLAGAALIVIGGPVGIGLLDAAAKNSRRLKNSRWQQDRRPRDSKLRRSGRTRVPPSVGRLAVGLASRQGASQRRTSHCSSS